MKKFIPLIIFISLAALLAIPLILKKDPAVLDSALIGKPVPVFNLPLLEQNTVFFSDKDLKGHVSVVNIFASWCVPCRAEQPALSWLKENAKADFYGINYKDKPAAATAFLKEEGNPYLKVAVDPVGRASIDWGIYGVPETFIVDRNGLIRYRHAGPVTMDDAKEKLLPLIKELSK